MPKAMKIALAPKANSYSSGSNVAGLWQQAAQTANSKQQTAASSNCYGSNTSSSPGVHGAWCMEKELQYLQLAETAVVGSNWGRSHLRVQVTPVVTS